jgi:hypothetical protein
MCLVSTKCVSHILVAEQDENQLNICTDILQKAKAGVNFIKSTTTSDEKRLWGQQ